MDREHDPSQLEMVVLMTPDMANFSGKVHGGALLNLLGPAVSATEDPADPGRVALRRLLADGIALGAIAECLREPAASSLAGVLDR